MPELRDTELQVWTGRRLNAVRISGRIPLTGEQLVRRLTAIFAADVAGYSRLTGIDEEGTHVRLKEHLRVLIDPRIAAHRGQIVKNTGDGFLAEFNSVVDAMRCAVDIQRGMAECNSDVPPDNRIEFRIGINVGDVIEDNGDIFADGVVEDITMALSRFHWLFVIARNSSFTYKGRTIDVKQVGRELGVRYVLEGSVRKAGNRIRIAGQLIDAETGAHLWADRFEGALEDMFDLQDHVTASVVSAITPKVQVEEIKRATRKPTENLGAYEYYLRGLAKVRRMTADANREALQLFCKAIELDRGLACAYGMAAYSIVVRKARGWMIEPVQESTEAMRLARKAVRLGGDDPVALSTGGYALATIAREFDDAAAFMDRGLAVNPNSAQTWMLSGWLRVWRGEPDLALDHLAHAMRLSPFDPLMHIHAAMAYAHSLSGRYDIASSYAGMAIRDNPTFLHSICISAASNAFA